MQRLTGVYFPKRLQVLHKLSRGQSKTGDVEARLSLECLWFQYKQFLSEGEGQNRKYSKNTRTRIYTFKGEK